MKFFVMSDVHGDAVCLKAALEAYEKECRRLGTPLPILMMGDLLYHGPRNPVPDGYAPKKCIEMYNEIAGKMIVIRGNCDADVDQMVLKMPIMAPYMVYPLKKGGRLVLTHGHHPFSDYFLEEGDAVLYGHTHILQAEKKDGITYLNPGSVSLPKEKHPKTYAVIEKHAFTIKTMDGAEVASIDF